MRYSYVNSNIQVVVILRTQWAKTTFRKNPAFYCLALQFGEMISICVVYAKIADTHLGICYFPFGRNAPVALLIYIDTLKIEEYTFYRPFTRRDRVCKEACT